MRYQLRYIRAQRTRSSPGAKHDDSPPEWARTNFLVPSGAPLSAAQQRVLPTRPRVLTFDVIRLLAPVPWLSGRASASHAEGRWFDPSRDHKTPCSSDVVLVRSFGSHAKYVPDARSKLAAALLDGQPGPPGPARHYEAGSCDHSHLAGPV
jgi:hypothetical protein